MGLAPDVPRLRWGTRQGLLQYQEPAFWVYVGLMAIGLLMTFAQQTVFRQISGQGWVLAWILVVVYAAPVILLVYLLDLFETEPMSLVVASFLWGAVAATAFAGFANGGWALVVARVGGPDFASQWTAALAAPLVEETLKVIGVVLIYLIARSEMDDAMDGFVYGAMVGLGFAVVEDVFYFMSVFGGKPQGVFAGFIVRVLASGLYGHVLYTGIAGIGVAYFVTQRARRRLATRWLVFVGLFLVATFGHFLWNSPLLNLFPAQPWTGLEWVVLPFAVAVKGLPFLGLVAMLVFLSRRRERAWLRAAAEDELAQESITATEMAILMDPRERRRSRKDLRARAGPQAASLLKRLQKAQIDLAMLRNRVNGPNDPALERQRSYCRSLRDALLAIPGAASAETTSAVS